MPLYTVSTQRGVLSDAAKCELAAHLTALHCELVALPRGWVHIIFQDYSAGSGFTGGDPSAAVALTLLIRMGQAPEYSHRLLQRLWDALQQATGAPDDQIVIGIQEVPAGQVMEKGQIMPDTRQ